MKKLIVTTLATCAAVGAFAQGSLTAVQATFSTDGITIPGVNSSDPSAAASSLYFTGNVTVALYYGATATQGQANAINALDGVSGPAAVALLGTDGFTLASATGLTGTTVGALPFAVSSGGFTAADPNQINLIGVPTGASEWIAMVVTGVGGPENGNEGVIVFQQNTGGNPFATPAAGTPADIVTDPAGLNVVLSPVPEPTTMALAALGGAAMLFIRRKK
jgi:hypothetical protein